MKTTTMPMMTFDDLLASWVPIKLDPVYAASENKITEIDKRRLLLGFASEGELEIEKDDSKDLLDLRLILKDLEEERQKIFLALKNGKTTETSNTKKDLQFRWIKKSFWSLDPGSKIMTGLADDPSVNVLQRQKQWRASIVVEATGDNLDHAYELQVLLTKTIDEMEEPLYWKSICTYSLVNIFQINENRSLIDDKKSFMGGNHIVECSLTTKRQCSKRLEESIVNKTLFNQKNGLLTLLDSIRTLFSNRPESIKTFHDSILALGDYRGEHGPPDSLIAFWDDTEANKSSFELSDLFELYVRKDEKSAKVIDLFEQEGLVTVLLSEYIPFPMTNENFLIKLKKTIANWQSEASTVKEISFLDVFYAVWLKLTLALKQSDVISIRHILSVIYVLPYILERFFPLYSEEIFDEINLRCGTIDLISEDESDFSSFFKRSILSVRKSHDFYHDFRDYATDTTVVSVTKITPDDSLVVKYPTYTNVPLLEPKTLLVTQKTSFSPRDLIGNQQMFNNVDAILLGDFLQDRNAWRWCKSGSASERGLGSSELNLVDDFVSTFFLEIDPTDDENESRYDLWLVSDLSLKTTIRSCDVITKQLVVSVIVRTALSVEKIVKVNSNAGENVFSHKLRLPSNQKLVTIIMKSDRSDNGSFRVLTKNDPIFPVLNNNEYDLRGFTNGDEDGKNSINLKRVFDENDNSSFYSAIIDSDLQEIFFEHWQPIAIPEDKFEFEKLEEDQKKELLRGLFAQRYGAMTLRLTSLIDRMFANNSRISSVAVIKNIDEAVENYLTRNKLWLSFSLAKKLLPLTNDKKFLSDLTVFSIYKSVLMDKVFFMFNDSVRYEDFGPFENLYYGAYIDESITTQIIDNIAKDLDHETERRQYELSPRAKKVFLAACLEEFGPSLITSWCKNVEEKWNEPENASSERKLTLMSDFCSSHAKTLENILVKLFRNNISRWWRGLLSDDIMNDENFHVTSLPSRSNVELYDIPEYISLVKHQLKELKNLSNLQSSEMEKLKVDALSALSREISEMDVSEGHPPQDVLLEEWNRINNLRNVQILEMKNMMENQREDRTSFLFRQLEEERDVGKSPIEDDARELYDISKRYEDQIKALMESNEKERISQLALFEVQEMGERYFEEDLNSHLKEGDIEKAENVLNSDLNRLKKKSIEDISKNNADVIPHSKLNGFINRTLTSKELEKENVYGQLIERYKNATGAKRVTDNEEKQMKRKKDAEQQARMRELQKDLKKKVEIISKYERKTQEDREYLKSIMRSADSNSKKLDATREELKKAKETTKTFGLSIEELESAKKQELDLQSIIANMEKKIEEDKSDRQSQESEIVEMKKKLDELTKEKELEETKRRELEEMILTAKQQEEFRKEEQKRQKEQKKKKEKEQLDLEKEETRKKIERLEEEKRTIERERLESEERLAKEMENITKEKEELKIRLQNKEKERLESEEELEEEDYKLSLPKMQYTTTFGPNARSSTSSLSTPTKFDNSAKKTGNLNRLPRTPEQKQRELVSRESPIKRSDSRFDTREREESSAFYVPDRQWYLSLTKLVRIKISKSISDKHPDYAYAASLLESFVESKRHGDAVIHAFNIYNVFLMRIVKTKIDDLIQTTNLINTQNFIERMGSLVTDFYYLTGDITGTVFFLSVISNVIHLHKDRPEGIIVNKRSFGSSIFNYFCLKMILCRGFCSDYQEDTYWIPDQLFEKATDVDNQYKNDFLQDFSIQNLAAYEREKIERFSPDPPDIKEKKTNPTKYNEKLELYETNLAQSGLDLFYDDSEGGRMIEYLKNRFKRFISLRKELKELIGTKSQTASSRWILSYITFYENFALNWMLDNYLSVVILKCCASNQRSNEPEKYTKDNNPIQIFKDDKILDKKAKPWNGKKGNYFVIPSYAEKAFGTPVQNYTLAFSKFGSSTPNFLLPSRDIIESFDKLLTNASKITFKKIMSTGGATGNSILLDRKLDFSGSMSYLFSKRRMRDFVFLNTAESIKAENNFSPLITDLNRLSGAIKASIPLFVLGRLNYLSSLNTRSSDGGENDDKTNITVRVTNQSFTTVNVTSQQKETHTLEMIHTFPITHETWISLIANIDKNGTSDSKLMIKQHFSEIGPRIDFFDANGHDEPNRKANFPPVVFKSYSSPKDCLTIFKILYELNPEWIFRADVLPSLKTRSWKIKVLKTDGSTGELYEESENPWGATKWTFFKKEIESEPIKRDIYDSVEDNHEKKRENDIADSLVIRKSITIVEKMNNRMPFLAVLFQLQKHSNLLSFNQSEILNGLIFEAKRFVDADQNLSSMGLYEEDLEPRVDYVSELLDTYERFETRRMSFEFTTKKDERTRSFPKMDAVSFLKKTCGKRYRSFYDGLHEKSYSAFEQIFEEFMVAYPHVRLLMYCYFYHKVNDGAKEKIIPSARREKIFLGRVSGDDRPSSMEFFDIDDALSSVPMYTEDGINYDIQMTVDSEDKKWFLREMGAKFLDASFERSTTVKGSTVNFVIEDKGSFLYDLSLWGKYALGMTRSEIAGLPMTRKFFGNVDIIGSTSVFELNSLISDELKPAVNDVVSSVAIPRFQKRRIPSEDSEIALDKYESPSEFACIGKRETRPDYRNAPKKFDALANADQIIADLFSSAWEGNNVEERKIVAKYKAKNIYENGTLVIKM